MYGDGFTSRSTRYTDERVDRLDQIEALREHDLEDVAFEDVLLRRLDRRGPLRVVQIRAHLGQLGELVGRRQRGHVRQRPARARRPRRRAARPRRRSSSRSVGVVAARLGVHVLDQEAALAEVVERGDLAGERAHRVGKPEIVVRNVGKPFDLAHGVVAHPADDAAVERREHVLRRARGTASAARRARRAFPRRTGCPAGGVAADPLELPAAGDERERRDRGPRNEKRPHRSACSTDSSRKPSRSPTSFTNAESGVSRSASTSRHTGTTVYSRACSANVSKLGRTGAEGLKPDRAPTRRRRRGRSSCARPAARRWSSTRSRSATACRWAPRA